MVAQALGPIHVYLYCDTYHALILHTYTSNIGGPVHFVAAVERVLAKALWPSARGRRRRLPLQLAQISRHEGELYDACEFEI